MMKIHKFSFSSLLFLTMFNLIESYLKFNIPSNRDKCFQTELYKEGTLLVRYHLDGFEKDFQIDELKELYKNIKIFIKDEKGKYIYETELKTNKHKFAIHMNENGNYFVCTRYYRPRRKKELPQTVMMGLKITNDYEYANLEDSLSKDDVTEFWKKIWEIKRNMRPTIASAELEVKEEDKTAKTLISSVEIYYKLCCLQLVIVVVATIYTIFTSQDFLKKKSII